MSDLTMPESSDREACVFIGEGGPSRVVAKVIIRYYPAVIPSWLLDEVLELATNHISARIAEQLNEEMQS